MASIPSSSARCARWAYNEVIRCLQSAISRNKENDNVSTTYHLPSLRRPAALDRRGVFVETASFKTPDAADFTGAFAEEVDGHGPVCRSLGRGDQQEGRYCGEQDCEADPT